MSGRPGTPCGRLRRPTKPVPVPIPVACCRLRLGILCPPQRDLLQEFLVVGHLLVRIELAAVVCKVTPPGVNPPGPCTGHDGDQEDQGAKSPSGKAEEPRPDRGLGSLDAPGACGNGRTHKRRPAPVAAGSKRWRGRISPELVHLVFHPKRVSKTGFSLLTGGPVQVPADGPSTAGAAVRDRAPPGAMDSETPGRISIRIPDEATRTHVSA